MKAIVLYRSISGFAKKYAQWIAEELGADLFDCRKVKDQALSGYDLIIFGGSLHAGGINGIDSIERNFESIAGKRIIIFVTGASPAREDSADEILAANFSEEQRKQLRLFYLRGGFNYGKLDTRNKIMILTALRKWKLRMKRGQGLAPDKMDMLAAFPNPADFTEREKIRPLVDYARS